MADSRGRAFSPAESFTGQDRHICRLEFDQALADWRDGEPGLLSEWLHKYAEAVRDMIWRPA